MTLTDPAYVRSDELLSRFAAKLLVVDVQEKLMPLIIDGRRVIANVRRLIEGCRAVGVPIHATEQYPKGLGGTVPEVRELLGDITIPEKLRFSSVECLGWNAVGETDDERDEVIVVGIEAHVCVLQTVHDLLAGGYRVHVVTDAVGSRQPLDRDVALTRFRDAGATLTTTETVLFELCEIAGTPEFKTISELVKRGEG